MEVEQLEMSSNYSVKLSCFLSKTMRTFSEYVYVNVLTMDTMHGCVSRKCKTWSILGELETSKFMTIGCIQNAAALDSCV